MRIARKQRVRDRLSFSRLRIRHCRQAVDLTVITWCSLKAFCRYLRLCSLRGGSRSSVAEFAHVRGTPEAPASAPAQVQPQCTAGASNHSALYFRVSHPRLQTQLDMSGRRSGAAVAGPTIRSFALSLLRKLFSLEQLSAEHIMRPQL